MPKQPFLRPARSTDNIVGRGGRLWAVAHGETLEAAA
jgi:hypothetical protein